MRRSFKFSDSVVEGTTGLVCAEITLAVRTLIGKGVVEASLGRGDVNVEFLLIFNCLTVFCANKICGR